MVRILYQILRVPEGRDLIHRPDSFGWYPLHILAGCRMRDRGNTRAAMARQLLEHGAATEVTKGQQVVTPLLTACGCGNVEVAKELLLFGADHTVETARGQTLFDYAWTNRELRALLEQLDVQEGTGVDGKGRLIITFNLNRN